jgi:hypothetical protein
MRAGAAGGTDGLFAPVHRVGAAVCGPVHMTAGQDTALPGTWGPSQGCPHPFGSPLNGWPARPEPCDGWHHECPRAARANLPPTHVGPRRLALRIVAGYVSSRHQWTTNVATLRPIVYGESDALRCPVALRDAHPPEWCGPDSRTTPPATMAARATLGGRLVDWPSRRRSSAVEQLFRKQQAIGSNPIAGSTSPPMETACPAAVHTWCAYRAAFVRRHRSHGPG